MFIILLYNAKDKQKRTKYVGTYEYDSFSPVLYLHVTLYLFVCFTTVVQQNIGFKQCTNSSIRLKTRKYTYLPTRDLNDIILGTRG